MDNRGTEGKIIRSSIIVGSIDMSIIPYRITIEELADFVKEEVAFEQKTYYHSDVCIWGLVTYKFPKTTHIFLEYVSSWLFEQNHKNLLNVLKLWTT
jgi:hypothetical protein